MTAFTNPVLPGCHPDPSICRVGEDYYLVTSTFEYWPGLPIFHSRDLVTWRQIGHAVDRPDQVDLSTVPSSGGLFAATIRHHDGLFFVACTLVHGQGRRGNFVLTASDPAGPWSDPFWLDDAPGIDPSLFFDDDGRAWMTGTRLADPGLWPGQTDVWLRQMRIERQPDPAQTPAVRSIDLVGEESLLWRGALHGAIWAEGPHLYRKDGRYYLVAAEGGTGFEHAVGVAAADAVTGPYLGNPANPGLTHRHLGRESSITGVGHADLVEHTDGTWWAVVLGSRPVGETGAEPLGRETFLVPVEWQNGWPVFAPGTGRVTESIDGPLLLGNAVDVRIGVPAGSHSDGAGDGLRHHAWSLVRTTREPRVEFFAGDPRRFDLHPRPVSLSDVGAPTFVGRRQQHHRAVFRASLTLWRDTRVRAGLAVRQSESDWIALSLRPLAARRPGPASASASASGQDRVFQAELHTCIAGVVSVVHAVALSAPPGEADAVCGVVVSLDDDRCTFSLELGPNTTTGDSGASRPSDRSDGGRASGVVRVGDVNSGFLTSPYAGGFLGVWLGAFAVSEHTSGDHAPAPVRVTRVSYEPSAEHRAPARE